MHRFKSYLTHKEETNAKTCPANTIQAPVAEWPSSALLMQRMRVRVSPGVLSAISSEDRAAPFYGDGRGSDSLMAYHASLEEMDNSSASQAEDCQFKPGMEHFGPIV